MYLNPGTYLPKVLSEGMGTRLPKVRRGSMQFVRCGLVSCPERLDADVCSRDRAASANLLHGIHCKLRAVRVSNLGVIITSLLQLSIHQDIDL